MDFATSLVLSGKRKGKNKEKEKGHGLQNSWQARRWQRLVRLWWRGAVTGASRAGRGLFATRACSGNRTAAAVRSLVASGD